METYLKSLYSGKNKIKNMFLAMGIMLVFMPSFGFPNTNNSSAEDKLLLIKEGKLVFLNENALYPLSDPSAPEPKVIRRMPVVVTAYSSTIWETDSTPHITAANTCVREGIIANNLYPFGTKIRIPELYGDKIFVVEDRMNKKKGNYHVDIWFPSHQEAKEFGAKKTYIEVLES